GALALVVDGGDRLDDAQRRLKILAGLYQRHRVLGKAGAAVAGPAWRNLVPIRLSRPMPRATSWTSAPTFSQRSAISLMKVILVARKPLAAYLISSEVSMPVKMIGVSIRKSGR